MPAGGYSPLTGKWLRFAVASLLLAAGLLSLVNTPVLVVTTGATTGWEVSWWWPLSGTLLAIAGGYLAVRR